MRRRSLHNCPIHERPRPNRRRSADKSLTNGKDETEGRESGRESCVQSGPVAETGINDVNDAS